MDQKEDHETECKIKDGELKRTVNSSKTGPSIHHCTFQQMKLGDIHGEKTQEMCLPAMLGGLTTQGFEDQH